MKIALQGYLLRSHVPQMISLFHLYCTLSFPNRPAGYDLRTENQTFSACMPLRLNSVGFNLRIFVCLLPTFMHLNGHFVWPPAFYCLPMQAGDFNLVSWNVWGLNSTTCCMVVYELQSVTLYASKRQSSTTLTPLSWHPFLGGYRLNSFAFKPAQGTKEAFYPLGQ